MLKKVAAVKEKKKLKTLVHGHWAGRKWFDILIKHCLTLICFTAAGADWIGLEMLSMCNILYIGQALPLSMRYDMALAKVQQNIVKSRMAAHKSPQLSSFSSCPKLSAKLQMLRSDNCSSDAM